MAPHCGHTRCAQQAASPPTSASSRTSAALSGSTLAAAYFTALANEAPAQAGPELKIIANAYTSIANGGISGGSVSQLEKQLQGLTTQGKTGQAFISLITYISTHCH